MTPDRQAIGRYGEDLAAHELEKLGFRIVDRNWRTGRGEIDLVAWDGDILVFVEVKTRRGRSMGTPEEGLTKNKSEKLLEMAQMYLLGHDLDVNWRIDLVAVELNRGGRLVRLEHIPNVVVAW